YARLVCFLLAEAIIIGGAFQVHIVGDMYLICSQLLGFDFSVMVSRKLGHLLMTQCDIIMVLCVECFSILTNALIQNIAT
ncbi:hypothetical protein ACJX0J_014500, partial [Zea mays]